MLPDRASARTPRRSDAGDSRPGTAPVRRVMVALLTFAALLMAWHCHSPTSGNNGGTQCLHYVGPLGDLPADLSVCASGTNVTGGYNAGGGSATFIGSVEGTVSGPISGGTFAGRLTGIVSPTCTAIRNYTGPISRDRVDWTPGDIVQACSGSVPPVLAAQVSLPATNTPPTTSTTSTSSPSTSSTTVTTTTVPPTTTTSTTTTVQTTSTTTSTSTSTTTTSLSPCATGFSAVPDQTNFPSSGGLVNFSVTAPAGCTWFAFESDTAPFAVVSPKNWTINQAFVGSQTGLQANVFPNNTATAVTGTMVISTTPPGQQPAVVASFSVVVAGSMTPGGRAATGRRSPKSAGGRRPLPE